MKNMEKETNHDVAENVKKGLKASHTEKKNEQGADSALENCQAMLSEWQEKYARLTADMDNFKKRTTKERADWAHAERAKTILPLLTIQDNFERAMALEQSPTPEMQSWFDGISMIYHSFGQYLQNAGVKEVSYDTFDPEYHEALIQVDSSEHDSGDVVEVMEKGYVLNDKVLRPAKVSVAK